MTETTHLLGLLLGTEEDWPTAFESIVRRMGPASYGAKVEQQHHFVVERVTFKPFDLL